MRGLTKIRLVKIVPFCVSKFYSNLSISGSFSVASHWPVRVMEQVPSERPGRCRAGLGDPGEELGRDRQTHHQEPSCHTNWSPEVFKTDTQKLKWAEKSLKIYQPQSRGLQWVIKTT